MKPQNKQQNGKDKKVLKKVIVTQKKLPAKTKEILKVSTNKEIFVKSKTFSTTKSPKGRSLGSQIAPKIEVILRCKGKHNLKSVLPSLTRSTIITPESGYEETGVHLNANSTVYKFDHVFYQECSQQKLYDRVGKSIVQEVLNGYNCTIFAYGQTGTGKTYTMEGDLENSNGKPAPNAGIVPRIICDLFQSLKKKEDTVKISMLELYNEEIRDLLRPENDTRSLNIFEDGVSGVKVQNVHEVMIANASQGLDIMKSGVKKRMTAATNCNEKSSRSHCIFTITTTFQKKNENGTLSFCTSKLNLVDLAGSENSKSSGSENLRAKEASSINKSLLTLGRVIKLLAEKSLHIPYRESKLTRLLKDSLGGRTKTAIIATIDPLVQNIEELKNTLEYSSHAKSICNIPQKNAMALYEKQMSELISDNLKLQDELHRSWNNNGCLSKNEYDEILIQIEIGKQMAAERAEEINQKELEIVHLKKEAELREAENTRLKKESEKKEAENVHLRNKIEEIYQTAQLSLTSISSLTSLKRERDDDENEEQPRQKKKV